MKKDGVEFSSCIVCTHTGELLNEALQNDTVWATLTV